MPVRPRVGCVSGAPAAPDAAVNRTQETQPYRGTMCIASRCMAWQWWNDPGDATKRRGYCGLAGKPQ